MAQIVVIGGTGQIGAKVVHRLRELGRDVRAASPRTGLDAFTGAGLDDALRGAEVVIDVAKPAVYGEEEVHAYFTTATENIGQAERACGVRHHIALSVVGTDRPHDVAYYRAKAAAEQIVRGSGVPYSILHATQFFEFAAQIATSATVDGVVVLPDALAQPVAGADVADVLVELALGAPLGSDLEIAGPEALPLADFVARVLRAGGDARPVHAGADGRYFGGTLARDTLLPVAGARLMPTRLEDWLAAAA